MRKTFLFSFFILLTAVSFAQFTVQIEFLPTNNAMLNACIDTEINMQANVSVTGVFTKETTTYTWYFGDNKKISGLGLDSVNYSYSQGGGYYVLLKLEDVFHNIRFARKKIQVGLKPKFDETTVNTDKSICLGDRVILSSTIKPNDWEFEIENQKVLDQAFQIADNYPQYTDEIVNLSYLENQTLNSVEQLSNISISMEHSNLSNLEIKLKCPTGKEVVLKNYGGSESQLGEPIADPSFSKGTPYTYTWNSTPTFGTMTVESATSSRLAAGSYASEENLSNLIGCPINGDWTITVTDNQASDNGFLFSWGIDFDNSLKEAAWTFQNTYNKNSVNWTGEGIGLPTNLTEGDSFTSTVFATPTEYGSTLYTLQMQNDFACVCDTAINVRVTQPSFSFTPEGGEAPIEISFTNETDWGTSFEWDFGYDSQSSIEENPVFTYRAEKDTVYKILFTTYSETSCKDTISNTLLIKVPNSEFDIPNVFTPNNDGNNDIWVIKPKAQDKELQDVLSELDCRIYNRYGRLVCKFKTPEEAKAGWDGSLNNKGNAYVSQGVYYYVIKTTGKDGKVLDKENQRGFLYIYK